MSFHSAHLPSAFLDVFSLSEEDGVSLTVASVSVLKKETLITLVYVLFNLLPWIC